MNQSIPEFAMICQLQDTITQLTHQVESLNRNNTFKPPKPEYYGG